MSDPSKIDPKANNSSVDPQEKPAGNQENPPAAVNEIRIHEIYQQLKTIAQRKPIPAKKQDLIQYLVERLQQAEDAISDTQKLLLEEQKQKGELMKELDEQTKQLNILLENEKQSLSDTAVLAKVQAEQEKKIAVEKLVERNYLINELNDQVFSSRRDMKNLGMKFNELLSQHQKAQMKILELQNQKQNLIEDNNNKDFQLKQTQRELEDSNNVIAQLTDVRNVLNRVHNNDILQVPGQSSQGFTQPILNNSSGVENTSHNRGLSGNLQNTQNLNNSFKEQNSVDLGSNGLRGTGVQQPDYMTNQEDFWFTNDGGDKKTANQTNFSGKVAQNDYLGTNQY